jgi:amidophosphoribosyltransferase
MAGAKRVSVVVTYPPIRYPCYAGIDFPSQEELIAFQHGTSGDSNNKIGSHVAQLIGADYVAYNDTASLARAIGMPEQELCFTCSTGNYASLGIRPVFKSRIQMKGE